MSFTVYTEWNTKILGGDELDESKHLAFSLYALGILEEAMPDLMNFLDGADAKVLVGPQMFSFSGRGDKTWHFVEDMAQRLQLLPWPDAETKH